MAILEFPLAALRCARQDTVAGAKAPEQALTNEELVLRAPIQELLVGWITGYLIDVRSTRHDRTRSRRLDRRRLD